jgi:hypothetical protein
MSIQIFDAVTSERKFRRTTNKLISAIKREDPQKYRV